MSELEHVANRQASESICICLVISHSPSLLPILLSQKKTPLLFRHLLLVYCVSSLRGQELLGNQKLCCLLHTRSPKSRGCYVLQGDAEALTLGNSPQSLKGFAQVRFPIISMYRPGKWAAALKSGFLKFC